MSKTATAEAAEHAAAKPAKRAAPATHKVKNSEAVAIDKIATILEGLTPAAVRRVLAWVNGAYAETVVLPEPAARLDPFKPA